MPGIDPPHGKGWPMQQARGYPKHRISAVALFYGRAHKTTETNDLLAVTVSKEQKLITG
jgi:hypothetical protein